MADEYETRRNSVVSADVSYVTMAKRNLCSFTGQTIQQQLAKARGAGMRPPPPASATESLFVFGGVLATALTLGALNERLVTACGDEWSLAMGPFGALLALQYALAPAPASQPRNAVFGQAIALAVSVGVSRLPTETVYVKQALAAAVAIMLMAKCAVVHPPAGASAVLFADGSYGWSHVLVMLLGNAIAIGMAVFINNLNPLRQYPTYWGFGNVPGKFVSTKADVCRGMTETTATPTMAEEGLNDQE